MKTVNKNKENKIYSLSLVCKHYNLKRDSYYKFIKRYQAKSELKLQVVSLVKERRKELPREGCRKLYRALNLEFGNRGLKVGRDSLFNILREHQMLVSRKKTSSRTTNSYHHFHKYNNLIQGLEIKRVNQVWVSDITYIRTINGFCYLALITDLYSRKIIAYDVSDTLELTGSLRALHKALRRTPDIDGLIHHSDRGVQYCSHPYTKELLTRNIGISMTEENHCYENAVAERVNGILKDEFYLDQTFFNVKHAQGAVKNAISLYNQRRLHLSLDYKTPNMVYNKIA
ncbi:MAG: IS3 family transposase [Bacteroidetes bacterium]|nr:MAG: IS3 family transposase [Bacteroidota bacterium]